MKMCKEMIKLRKGLDERGIVWIDASETYRNDKIKALEIDIAIYRTHFTAYGVWFSVIYGLGTYGEESGLLECMSKAVDESGEPKGSMTADEILEVIDELKNDVEDALKSIIDAPITKAEPIKYGRWIMREKDKLVPTGKIAVSEGHILHKTSFDKPFTLQSANIIKIKEHRTVKIPYCSICGNYGNDEYDKTPYCPYCGARMDGDVNDA